MCVCNWGYRLDPDMRGCSGMYNVYFKSCSHKLIHLLDIDECAERISGCNQTCTNIIGNYSCSCEPGLYTLNPDGHACDGM